VLPFRSVRAVRRLATSSVGDLIRLLRPLGAGAVVAAGQNAVAGRQPERMTRGVVVVGHGTADPVGAEETRQVAALVAGLLPEVPVELGFLEVIGPSIGVALERLAERGCGEVVAAPLLLFTAGHARRDVPEAVRDGAAKAGLAVRQSEALGCHPAMLALSRQRRQQAVERLEPMPAEDTVLLMIGRGSSDPTAHRQLHGFALATCPDESEPPTQARIELGFVAAARPTLAEAVANAAGGGGRGEGRAVRRVIVQPHLLFRGHVEEQVTAAVERGRREHPGIEWVQVERLGADPLVARAVVDRVAAVMASCGEVTA
jgi:sirohydrochlorin cobaltochelatase